MKSAHVVLLLVIAANSQPAQGQEAGFKVQAVDTANKPVRGVVYQQEQGASFEIGETDDTGTYVSQEKCRNGAMIRVKPKDRNYFSSEPRQCRANLRVVVSSRRQPTFASANGDLRRPVIALGGMDGLENDAQTRAFTTMIETAIVATDKFRVADRPRFGALFREREPQDSPNKSTLVEPDYLIYGTVTDVSITKRADFGAALMGSLLRDNDCSGRFVTVSADIKITDFETGEIKYATRITEGQKVGPPCDAAEVDTNALLRAAANKVASGLITAIYPVRVARLQRDGTIVLDYGQSAISPGQIMAVYASDGPITDPATGAIIATGENKIGLIRITEVNDRTSRAALISGVITVGAMVRAASVSDIKGSAKRRHTSP